MKKTLSLTTITSLIFLTSQANAKTEGVYFDINASRNTTKSILALASDNFGSSKHYIWNIKNIKILNLSQEKQLLITEKSASKPILMQ